MPDFIDDYWVQRSIPWNDGFVNPTMPNVNSSIVLTYSELITLIASITSPTLIDSMKTFFVDPSESISSVKVFPMSIPRKNVGRLSYITTQLTYSGDNCTGAYIDDSFLETLHLAFDKVLGTAQGELAWHQSTGFTKVYMYLPFYGEVELPATDVVNKRVRVHYSLSETGDIMYFITVVTAVGGTNFLKERLLTKYQTNIAVDIPIGSSNLHSVNRNLVIQAAKGAVAIASIGAFMASGATLSTVSAVSSNPSVIENYAESYGRGEGKYAKLKKMSESTSTTRKSDTRTYNSQTQVPTSKLIIDCGNAVASSSIDALRYCGTRPTAENTKSSQLEQFGPRRIIVSVFSPLLNDDGHEHFYGLPLVKRDAVSNYQGFTKLSAFRLNNFSNNPTATELTLLEDLLVSGFIIRPVEPEV